MRDSDKKVYTLQVEPYARWYPKKDSKKEVKHNDWQINRVRVIKKVEVDDDFQMDKGQITLVGNMVAMEKGLTYTVRVVKEYNEKYNSIQYAVVYSQEIREFKTEQQVKDFLLMFISHRQIDALYKVHSNPLEVIDARNVDLLCEASGIGKATAERIIARYEACKDYGPTYGELGKLGITKNMIDKLIEHFKSADTVLHYVKNDPYILADEITGIGFRKADEIALNNGVHRHDVKRVRAFIIYSLN